MATEEIEVNVNQVETKEAQPSPFVEGLRRLMLAAVGAVAMTRDEMDVFVKKLVERGELAQKDGQKLMHEVSERMKVARPAETQARLTEAGTRISEQLETGFEQFLNRLNIPSKRDIDELSEKIAQLAARVEELRKN